MITSRRAFFATFSALGLALGSYDCLAQPTAFPSQPVRIIVPFPPGGLTDVLVRGLGQELQALWKQPVVVDNRPGANNIIGADLAAKSPADGHTLFFANNAMSANLYLYKKLPYDFVRDFVAVTNMVKTDQILVVPATARARTLGDFLAEAKNQPGQLKYGTYGLGSVAHLDTEELARRTDTKFIHVPYKGVTEVMLALMSGQIDFSLVGVPAAISPAQSGKIRALALAATERVSVFKDVPTFQEAGLPHFESTSWFGLLAPKATPRQAVNRIANDVAQVLARPDFQQKYVTGVGLSLLVQGPDEFARYLENDRNSFRDKVTQARVQLD